MDDTTSRLHRCIRDLGALNALPSMCIGRSPEEALEIVLDALPTALSCELVHLTLGDGAAHARLRGSPAAVEITAEPDADGLLEIDAPERLSCLSVEVPIGSARGRLVVGRRTPFDRDTDRVLVRSAANLVGSTLEGANVLEKAKRKDEFLAMLGHELRNPLAPILTAVELLARHQEATRERDVIDRHTKHLARLVDDLLDISRVTCAHIELRNEPVALGSVLQRAVELATPLIIRSRHSLVVGNADGIMVEGDPVRLAQVFGNILTNAAKFTPPGGKIELSVERLGDRVRIAIKDEGRGIPRDQLSRIFEPFVQIDRRTDASRGGLGLGLAIVKNLVDRHRGTITAASDGLGRGSTFSIELPVMPIVAAPVVKETVLTEAGRRGVRVLVVDDNVDIADLLSEALERQGFETSLAYNARDAIDGWPRFSPHAAVLDVGLPDLDGYELARTIRAEHGRKPVLIAATGYGQPTDRLRAHDAGFDCHFVKPVSVQELVRALDGNMAARPT